MLRIPTKTISIFIFSLTYYISVSQSNIQTSGVATYHAYAKKFDMSGASKVYADMIGDMMDTESPVEIKVTFNSGRSLSQAMISDTETSGLINMAKIEAETNGSFCFDWQTRNIVNHKSVEGQKYLIEKSVDQIEWQLIDGDPEMVNGQLCSKAEIRKIRNNVLLHDTLVTTVWYADQIPIPIGPSEFVGLPGLIVKVDEKKGFIVLKDLSFEPIDPQDVECPSDGQPISWSDYSALEEKSENLMLQEWKAKFKQYGIKF
jgi:GLPGLI family protein